MEGGNHLCNPNADPNAHAERIFVLLFDICSRYDGLRVVFLMQTYRLFQDNAYNGRVAAFNSRLQHLIKHGDPAVGPTHPNLRMWFHRNGIGGGILNGNDVFY